MKLGLKCKVIFENFKLVPFLEVERNDMILFNVSLSSNFATPWRAIVKRRNILRTPCETRESLDVIINGRWVMIRDDLERELAPRAIKASNLGESRVARVGILSVSLSL